MERTREQHGMWKSLEYKTWTNMKSRCFNKNVPNFDNYGGRGITVCDRWKDSFVNFYEDMGDKPEGLTLDRIDNDEGYSPDNCRWATFSQQLLNRRQLKSKLGEKNISQYRGKYRVEISRGCVLVNYGTYGLLEDAVEVRDTILEELDDDPA